MVLPSKELLTEVFGERVTKVHTVTNNKLSYATGSDSYRDVNIYELVHLMKVWAIQAPRFIEIFSATTVSGKGICCVVTEACGLEEVAMYEESYIYGDTEFEAVTQACEWILKQGGP